MSLPATNRRDDSPRAGPFACFSQGWRVTCDDRGYAALFDELYAPMSAPKTVGRVVEYRVATPRGTSPDGEVWRDGRLLGRALRPAQVLGKLVWAVNRQVIDGAADDLLLMHAAAAADAQGRVVLLPAPTESGKTTLVTGLLDRGLAYLTDEAAAVEPDLRVHGFPKPLSIDRGAWRLLANHAPRLPPSLAPYMRDQWQVPAHRFASVVRSGRLAMIVFPAHVPGAPTTWLPLDPVPALDRARANVFGSDGRPLPVARMRQLAKVVSGVPCFALRSGSLGEACDAVLEGLEHHGAR